MVKVKGQMGQVIILMETLFFEYFYLDQLQTLCESSIWSTTQLICFEGRSILTFIVNARVENGVPRGQILKSKELYHVLTHMKTLDECFQDQLTFSRYDVI
jgi:hypothetical protein